MIVDAVHHGDHEVAQRCHDVLPDPVAAFSNGPADAGTALACGPGDGVAASGYLPTDSGAALYEGLHDNAADCSTADADGLPDRRIASTKRVGHAVTAFPNHFHDWRHEDAMCGGAAFVDCAAEGGTAPTHRVAAADEGHAESLEGHATNVIHNVFHQFPALFQARRQASTQEEGERAGAAREVEAEFPEEAEGRRAVVLGEEGNALGDGDCGVLHWRPRDRLRGRHVLERDFEVHELLGEVVIGKGVPRQRASLDEMCPSSAPMQHRLAWDRLMQMQHLHHCQGFR